MDEVLDSKYLPFTKKQLLNHFTKVKYRGCTRNERHLNYYNNSISKYHKYLSNTHKKGEPLSEMKIPCQIEKDERFWTASCMMTMFYDDLRQQMLTELFTKAYGSTPPITGLSSWEDCLKGDLALFFEANLPSPTLYNEWLNQNLEQKHFIPHILKSADGKRKLEGATYVDALIINPRNGFAVVVEAKVLSDISIQITYDVTRNQIARTIDIMLEENKNLCEPLSKRNPERTLFLLLTPRIFKTIPSHRLYGYKFNDYKKNPKSLASDLPHRKNRDWQAISDRLGWLTWEDFHKMEKNCCSWLSKYNDYFLKTS